MPDYSGHYAEMENGLRVLLSTVAGLLSADDTAEVGEFIDAREYGLALQTLAAILLENPARFDGQVIEQMQELAGAMGLGDDAAINSVVAEHRRRFRVAM